MVRPFPKIPKPGRRSLRQTAIVAGVIAGHALALALLCWRPQPVQGADAGMEGQVVLASLVEMGPSAPAPATHAVAPKARSRPPESPTGTQAAAPDDPASSSPPDRTPQLTEAQTAALDGFQPVMAEGAPDQPCNLTGMMADLLSRSPVVQQALADMPPAQRSVANAVNLWDGEWPEDSLSGGKGLLRAILAKAVGAARPDCLTVANHGPALFFIPDNRTTVVLAVGSGEWRWGDLIAPMSGAVVADNYLGGLASR